MVSFCWLEFDLKMQFAGGGLPYFIAVQEKIVDSESHTSFDSCVWGNGLLLVPALEVVQTFTFSFH